MNEKKTTINNYTITISTYLSSIPTQNNCWNSMTIIASLDLLHFIKEKLDWHYLDYLWCPIFEGWLWEKPLCIFNSQWWINWKINYNKKKLKCYFKIMSFIFFLFALYFCCKVGRQQQWWLRTPRSITV